MTKTLWLRVSQDKYELPEAVADNPAELARICGTTANSIMSMISHYKAWGYKCKYIKVEVEDDYETDK